MKMCNSLWEEGEKLWDQYIEQVRTDQKWFGNQTYNVINDFPNLIDQEIG